MGDHRNFFGLHLFPLEGMNNPCLCATSRRIVCSTPRIESDDLKAVCGQQSPACMLSEADRCSQTLHAVSAFSSVQVLVLYCEDMHWDKSDLPQALNLPPITALTGKHKDGYAFALKRSKSETSIKFQKGGSLSLQQIGLSQQLGCSPAQSGVLVNKE